MNKYDQYYTKIWGGLSHNYNLLKIAQFHNVDLNDIKKEFDKGEKVEMEHTPHIEIAREIALDHLKEDPKYYTKLAEIENK